MTSWPLALAAEELRIAGPEDEFDDETNGDPDSLLGEEDDDGYEEMADYPDEPMIDDGFDDAEGDEDEEGDDDEDGVEADCDCAEGWHPHPYLGA